MQGYFRNYLIVLITSILIVLAMWLLYVTIYFLGTNYGPIPVIVIFMLIFVGLIAFFITAMDNIKG